MHRSVTSLFIFIFAWLVGGCSHYRLGTGAERDYTSIFIAPFETAGQLPQATAMLTSQAREAFIRDGRLRVVNTADEADAVLLVRIARVEREMLTATPADSGLARKLGVGLAVLATLRDPSGEKVWFADRPLRLDQQIFTDDGSAPSLGTPAIANPHFLQPVQQTQAEFQLLPQLGESLATQLKSAVLDTW
ncbi:MAG: hypothetical protein EAZ36_04745 [Verrucomicrobia bacterium]|nr:MAG: hypothetical protein EAZ36_04745 [Verrucomicrobiota bacterium]